MSDDIKKFLEAVTGTPKVVDKTDAFIEHSLAYNMADYYENQEQDSRAAVRYSKMADKIEADAQAKFGNTFANAMKTHTDLMSELMYSGGREGPATYKLRVSSGVDQAKWLARMEDQFSGIKFLDPTPSNAKQGLPIEGMLNYNIQKLLQDTDRDITILRSKRSENKDRSAARQTITPNLEKLYQTIGKLLGK